MVWWSQLDKPLPRQVQFKHKRTESHCRRKIIAKTQLEYDCIDKIDITPNIMRLTNIMATVAFIANLVSCVNPIPFKIENMIRTTLFCLVFLTISAKTRFIIFGRKVPAEDPTEIVAMVLAGMNIARISLASASRTNHLHTIRNVRKAERICSAKAGQCWPVAIAVELKGQSMRTGLMDVEPSNLTVSLKVGDTILLTSNCEFSNKCSAEILYIDCPQLYTNLTPGSKILIDRGKIVLVCIKESPPYYLARVDRGGNLGSLREVSIPGMKLNLCNLTSKDAADIAFAIENEVDILIVPYVRNAKTIKAVKNLLVDHDQRGLVLSKISNEEGLLNLDSILEVSDGIIISQDNLSVELQNDMLWRAVNHTIAKCIQAGAPVFFATAKLDRRVGNGGSCISAASDVSGVVLAGVSGVSLEGGELGDGGPGAEGVAFAAEVCKQAEPTVWPERDFGMISDNAPRLEDPSSSLCYAAALAARLTGACCILVVSSSVRPARWLARVRPSCPLLVVVGSEEVGRCLHLYRGVVPLVYKAPSQEEWKREVTFRTRFAVDWGMCRGCLRAGAPLVFISDYTLQSAPGNVLRIVYVPKNRGQDLVEWPDTHVESGAAGAAAAWAENLKRNKYRNIIQDFEFVAFAVETLGPWSSDAKSFLKRLGPLLVDATGVPQSRAYFVQRVIAIQRGNAASVLGTFLNAPFDSYFNVC